MMIMPTIVTKYNHVIMDFLNSNLFQTLVLPLGRICNPAIPEF